MNNVLQPCILVQMVQTNAIKIEGTILSFGEFLLQHLDIQQGGRVPASVNQSWNIFRKCK